MQRYREFQPTGFDPKGAFLGDDQQDWFVVPVSRTRDTGAFSDSNFESALAMLGGEEPGLVEVHNFGHWGPGWFEIIIVAPYYDREEIRSGAWIETIEAQVAHEIESALADYPCLDEMDLSDREVEAQDEAWESWARSDYERALVNLYHFDEEVPPHVALHFQDIEELVDSIDDLEPIFNDVASDACIYWHTDSDESQYIDVAAVADATPFEVLWHATPPGKMEAESLAKQRELFA
ncbi:MAG: hypothetical protein ACYSW3_00070 [Planctomycetota bacterium]|jgi:hypothetical protein